MSFARMLRAVRSKTEGEQERDEKRWHGSAYGCNLQDHYTARCPRGKWRSTKTKNKY